METAYLGMNLASAAVLCGGLGLVFGYAWGYERAEAAQAQAKAHALALAVRDAERRKVLWFKTKAS